mmetsp:Transcript_20753/g.26803  ORF Transcript_20753/g.26803 Transcript_20753/m.26803 type:complete len:228 (+) Transcript_20753:99-782(+)
MANCKIESQPKLKLYYFDIKGKGEAIRLFCAYAGLELEDVRLSSYADFLELKESGKIAFGQVPLLEVDGKHALVQTSAILRYLSKLAPGLYPDMDPILAAKIDAALDQATDVFTGTLVLTYSSRFGIPLDDDTKAKSYKTINEDVLPRHLTSVEKLFQDSSTGWIAGTDEPSAADFEWYVQLAHYLPEKKELNDKIKSLEEYPLLKDFIQKFEGLEAIKEYYDKQSK